MGSRAILLSLCLLIVAGCSLYNIEPSKSQIVISETIQSHIPNLEPARIALESTCRIFGIDKETGKKVGNATATLVSITLYCEGQFLERYILITAAHAVKPVRYIQKTKKEVQIYWQLESYRYDSSGKIISIQITDIKPGSSGVEIIRYDSIDTAVLVLDVFENLILATPALAKKNDMLSTPFFWDKIIVSGCSHFQRPLVREGRINQVGVKYMYPHVNSINCPVTYGDSGGGVFDTQGRLIGVIGVTFTDGVGGGYIPLRFLEEKLNKHRPELSRLIWR